MGTLLQGQPHVRLASEPVAQVEAAADTLAIVELERVVVTWWKPVKGPKLELTVD